MSDPTNPSCASSLESSLPVAESVLKSSAILSPDIVSVCESPVVSPSATVARELSPVKFVSPTTFSAVSSVVFPSITESL